MKNQPIKFVAGFLLLSSLIATAQHENASPEDQKIINKYCASPETEAEKEKVKGAPLGAFVRQDGKTTLKCISESVRYFFEKTNSRLDLENPRALTNKPYEKTPDSWKQNSLDYLLALTRGYDDTCYQIDMVANLPVVKCASGDRIISAQDYEKWEAALVKMYDEGAKNFANDPDKTEIGVVLINKDALNPSADLAREKLNYSVFKGYFERQEQTSRFPAYMKVELPDFFKATGFNRFNPYSMPQLNYAPTPLKYRNLNNVNFANYSGFAIRPTSFPDGTPVAPRRSDLPVATTTTSSDVDPAVDPAVIQKVEPLVIQKIEEDPKELDKKCQDELAAALSKVLEDDKKNIIGKQYELTVMKMASIALGENSKSLEGMIKSHSEKIKQLDNGVIDEMNKVYKAHGLAEDAKSITDHLKVKATKANYLSADKRFFNQDSSAFVLAYQKMNPTSGLKDTDVSVLWFMDKVTKKAQTGAAGKYSSMANRTNLSTRITQYTGLINKAKALSQKEIDNMVIQQKKQLDLELLAVVEDFKENNASCYTELFTEGKSDCELTVVEGALSQLLALNSKIPSADQVSIDKELKGGLDTTRFKISRFVAN